VTSTCFISKQFGVPTMKTIIREINVFLHIIGKILEESHSSISIRKNSVLTGDRGNLLTTIKMDALMSTSAIIVMAGKNRSITQKSIN